MKAAATLALLCVSVVCWASPATPVVDYLGERKLKISDKVFLEKEKNILRLFKYINQRCGCKDELKIANSFSVEASSNDYTNPQVVKQFLIYYKQGLLPRGHIFSVFNEVQLRQAISLFKLFYYAKDFDTFYKTAVWARNYLNEGLFIYAFSVAIAHRADTYGIIIPPIYEVFPNYFFSSEVISEAQQYKQGLKQSGEVQKYVVVANLSKSYLNLNPEQSLSYYIEDLGLNAFYYYTNVYHPFWMGGEEFKLSNDRRGEQYYFVHQQLLARYYMERLSNGLGEVETIDWDEPVKTGYYPSLRYTNGLEFPTRPNFARISDYFYTYGQSGSFRSKYGYSRTLIKDYERRIRDVIDWGRVQGKNADQVDIYTSPQGIDILGNIVEGNPDSLSQRFFGSLQLYARHLLGYSTLPLNNDHILPSALEHFETACRDPVFYQLYKRITLLFQKYKSNLSPYSYTELFYPGVKVENIDVDRLTTYFDYFDTDITNAIYLSPEELEKENVQVVVKQLRLNHKPFTYRINVNSESAEEAVVRVFIGPKYDEYERFIDIGSNRVNFLQLDNFRCKLKAGKNVLERNSRQLYWFVPDKTSYRDIYKKVLGALTSGEMLQTDASESFFGFPNSLLLPLGDKSGQVFQIYVIVNPYKVPSLQQKPLESGFYYQRVGTGNNYVDDYAFGYPFDRPIDEYNFYVPNAAFQDVTIYHKGVEGDSNLNNEP